MEAWLSELERGRPETAWDLFLERYRRLIFATIRHYVREHDDVMDVFTRVCEALREDDLRRLRGWAAGGKRARFSTWLVVVVHNLTVDWVRAREGRPRPSAMAERLTPLQRAIYEQVFMRGVPAAEAYEILRAREWSALRFGPFLKELRTVHRAVGDPQPRVPAARLARSSPNVDSRDPAVEAEARELVAMALGALPNEDRAAVQLYVVEGLSAAEVARLLDLEGSKAVYNRVYRALAAVRQRLERAGIHRDSVL